MKTMASPSLTDNSGQDCKSQERALTISELINSYQTFANTSDMASSHRALISTLESVLAGTHISRVVMCGLGDPSEGDEQILQQLSLIHTAHQYIQRLTPGSQVQWFHCDRSLGPLGAAFLRRLGIRIAAYQERQDPRSEWVGLKICGNAYGQNSFAERSSVAGASELITGSTLLYMPYFNCEPALRVLAGRPAVVICCPLQDLGESVITSAVCALEPAADEYIQQWRDDVEIWKVMRDEFLRKPLDPCPFDFECFVRLSDRVTLCGKLEREGWVIGNTNLKVDVQRRMRELRDCYPCLGGVRRGARTMLEKYPSVFGWQKSRHDRGLHGRWGRDLKM